MQKRLILSKMCEEQTARTKFCLVFVDYPTPSEGMGAWRKTMEPQKPSSSPEPGPEIVERQRVAKE